MVSQAQMLIHQFSKLMKKDVSTMNIKKGFTLIELLVVISILGILAGLVISNVSSVRERARDVARKSDLDQMKKALRMYYNDNNAYPAVTSALTGGTPIYIKVIPVDPNTNDSYTYSIGTCTDDFRLIATLENKSDSDILKSQQKCVPNICGMSQTYETDQYVVCAD